MHIHELETVMQLPAGFLAAWSPQEDSRGAVFLFFYFPPSLPWLSKDIISPPPPPHPHPHRPRPSTAAACKGELEGERELGLVPGPANLPEWRSVNCFCVCPVFSSRLWLTRKVEITNAWALCLGGLAKKEQTKKTYKTKLTN